MPEQTFPPFSVRNRGAHAQIDDDCPETTRVGLLHLLRQLVKEDYVANWGSVVGELQRIARVTPNDESHNLRGAERILMALQWDKVFDFCERLYGHLAKDAYQRTGEDSWERIARKDVVQEYIAEELQRLFLEEHLALEFSSGLVRRRGRRNTAEQVGRAELVLGEPRLSAARMHYNKALGFFRNVSKPDYENVVKEAVCAVEATAKALFPSGGSTLGDIVKSVTGSGVGQLPKQIANTFHGLYGFRSGGEGVGHGGATGGVVTKDLAEYSLAIAASQIALLFELASASEPEIPF